MRKKFGSWNRGLLLALVLLAALPPGAGTHASSDTLRAAEFSTLRPGSTPADFQERAFAKGKRKTRYELVTSDRGTVLRAESRNSASALVKTLRVDPRRFPDLEWSWKVEGTLPGVEWGKKGGDDFAARLFVIFDRTGGSFPFLGKLLNPTAGVFPGRALNYVWGGPGPSSDNSVQGVFSPYTKQVFMLPVEEAKAKTGVWVSETRNVLEDYRHAFGEEPPDIVGIAIMTDSDDTHGAASACYGDIRFFRR